MAQNRLAPFGYIRAGIFFSSSSFPFILSPVGVYRYVFLGLTPADIRCFGGAGCIDPSRHPNMIATKAHTNINYINI